MSGSSFFKLNLYPKKIGKKFVQKIAKIFDSKIIRFFLDFDKRPTFFGLVASLLTIFLLENPDALFEASKELR